MSQYLAKCAFAVVFALALVIGHSSAVVAQNVDWQLHNLDLH